MSDLPSTEDEIWDGHLHELITSVRDKKWHAVLMALNRMSKTALYELAADIKELRRG